MDKKQIEEMYNKNLQTVYKFLYSQTNNMLLAEELTQETFYQAIKGIDKFRGDCSISVWLCQIAKNLWYKELARRKKRGEDFLHENITSNDNVEQECIENVERVELFRLMHNLDPTTREVMYLRLSGDLQFSEIADILGKTENWARVTFYRGKQKLVKGREEWNKK
ncbi:MAG: sigma-70 family RNA polymerase sigma factor [Clostridium sp.]|nr:sigma-70 family RNA polymerase sigma factor [Clostridium sp.]MCM1173261.1 sigma-70 family RNA polymerase sigma factor [Clostridium sp.]MCM1209917.1 sigma-70 family RNA polymerase sigma factor [Ruminococcus sp.]MCM1400063.1 sigma-70 family RNA polymerase sigma factor [Clostridium sp.]MCM1459661.1 sigma-70 family RNA polymerase sigma factor [Bacteroides sp.]